MGGFKYVESLYLILVFSIQTLLILAFLPIFWFLASTPILPDRFVDQLIKLIIFLFLGYTWLLVFKYLYYKGYRSLSRCR